MTRLFARVRSRDETQEVARAGFDGIMVEDPAIGRAGLDRLHPDLRDGAVKCLVLTTGDHEPRTVHLFGSVPDGAALDRVVAERAAGILLGSPGRLVDATTVPILAMTRTMCRSRGLLCGFAGDLEAPDLPRLLVLDPDWLVVGRALRWGRAPDGALDPAALAQIRALVPAQADRSPAGSQIERRLDRIFLRDLVLPIAIGAYDSERGRLQRVRFSVEADLRPTGRPTRDMRDVVSYDLFTDAIHALTTDRHVDFVETLAEEIAERVLAHPRVLLARITVEKLDVGPGAVGVSIERAKRQT